ncbi:cystatin-like [Carcharodon carcharias]|uniref:cystatin-like n=1 Tax=Carcharodon carcharias TaxID=13397 RepID=UPI001B7F0F87|nr:cystatin-like [Carcharodon carcharias]
MKMAAGMKLLLGAAALLLLLQGGDSIPGGISPADMNSEEVQKAARYAVDHFNRGSNDIYLSKMRRLISAKQQVVAGMMYRLKMELGTTTCRKSMASNVNLNTCNFHPGLRYAKRIICKFQIWDRPWLSQLEVVKKNCTIL